MKKTAIALAAMIMAVNVHAQTYWANDIQIGQIGINLVKGFSYFIAIGSDIPPGTCGEQTNRIDIDFASNPAVAMAAYTQVWNMEQAGTLIDTLGYYYKPDGKCGLANIKTPVQ